MTDTHAAPDGWLDAVRRFDDAADAALEPWRDHRALSAVMTAGMAMLARMPRIRMTISISMRVKPASLRSRCSSS